MPSRLIATVVPASAIALVTVATSQPSQAYEADFDGYTSTDVYFAETSTDPVDYYPGYHYAYYYVARPEYLL
jgi:hypothetical protein